MKKVLSFVLVLSMILGSFGMAFAAVPSDVVGKDYEDAVNVLMELGVVDGYKDGTYRPENVISRAEMATMIIKAMGLNDYAVGKSSFTDMTGHWADAYVAYAASLGFISGYGDGTFRPSQTVTYDQAITMVVQALGYKAEYLVGGYPGAFVNQAKALGLLDGIKSGAAGANRGDIATLLHNALDASFVRYDKDGGLEYTGDCMMTRLGAVASDAEFILGDAEIENAAINLKGYQGALVKAWYNSDDRDEIIAVEAQSVFVKGDFDKKDQVFETADKEYSFKDGAQQAGYKYFVNGVETATRAAVSIDDMMTGEYKDVVLAVKTSGKYITKVYSASVWDAKATIQWDEDDAEALAEDQKIKDYGFIEDDNDEIDMNELVLVGVASLKDIKEDDVVTYYVNGSNEIVKIEVSSTVVTGKVTKADNADKAKEVTIGGKKYDVAKDCATIKLGDEGKFFLNYAGDIAFVDVTTTEANDYAVVLKENGFDTAAFGEDAIMKIKLLTADGKKTVYTIEEDYADTLSTGGAVTTTFGAASIVSYNVDKNGEVDLIKNTTVSSISGKKLTSKGYLAGYKVADTVVVFKYDSADKEYSVGKLSDVPTNESLTYSKYILNSDEEVAVIVLDDRDSVNDDAVYGVVVSKAKVKNDDDETVWEINMLVDGKEVTYLSTTTLAKAAIPTKQALYEISFDGSVVKQLDEVTATANAIESNVTVEAIKDGNLKVGDKYVEVSADVVVYLINEDGDFELSKFSKISKGDIVTMYELDNTKTDLTKDENGIDVIILKEK